MEVTAAEATAVIVGRPTNHEARPATAGAALQVMVADLGACRVMAAAGAAMAAEGATVAVRTARPVPVAVILRAAIPPAEAAAIPAAVATPAAIPQATITETSAMFQGEVRRREESVLTGTLSFLFPISLRD